jgi:ribonucleotide monophosphatase NagD (HAD superfamily)
LEGIWAAVTGGEKKGVILKKEVIGKPFPKTFEFAEKKLIGHRKNLFQDRQLPSLKRVFMVGDNPGESIVSFNHILANHDLESDIRGGNSYKSPHGVSWSTILVKTGVHGDGVPAWEPTTTVPDVFEAVRWVLTKEHWQTLPPQ